MNMDEPQNTSNAAGVASDSTVGLGGTMVWIDKEKLIRAIVCNTDANEQDARAIVHTARPLCSHPSWHTLNADLYKCELCGAEGRELRYLAVTPNV